MHQSHILFDASDDELSDTSDDELNYNTMKDLDDVNII